MQRDAGILEGLRRNAVALISLFIALSGLGYNTWRNETTESHRNTRQAAFMMLQQLGELQQLVDERFYAGKATDVNRIAGWGKVALLRDISGLVSAPASQQAAGLFASWQGRLDALDAGDAGAERDISQAIKQTREQVLRDLESLQ